MEEAENDVEDDEEEFAFSAREISFPLPDYAKRARNSESQQQSYSSSDAIRRGGRSRARKDTKCFTHCVQKRRKACGTAGDSIGDNRGFHLARE